MYKILIAIFGLFLTGCSLRPELPDTNFKFDTNTSTFEISDKWWEEFGDANLNNLVELALKNNIDIKIAVNNLQKSQIALGISKLELLPTLGLKAEATRNATPKTEIDKFGLSAILNYEIDLWGRVRNSVLANESQFRASKFDYENIKLSIASGVVFAYFRLLSLQEQEDILTQSLNSYEKIANQHKIKYEVGSITPIVYYQSKSQVDNARVSLNAINEQIVSAKNALNLLISAEPNEIVAKDFSYQISNNFDFKEPEIPAEIPSDILLKRADIAASLERLKASNALVGVARAAYFPKLSLTGLFGFSSFEFDELLKHDSSLWAVGANLAMPIFNQGKISGGVKIANLDQNTSFLNYQKVVKTALGEVKTALDDRKNAKMTMQSLDALNISVDKVYELAKIRFDEGYSDQIEFLNAQNSLLNAKLSASKAKFGLLNSIVNLYKALGGGIKIENSE